MVDPVTTNRSLAVPTHGSDVNTWDVPLNANAASLDSILGSVLNVSTTGGTTVDLTIPQANNAAIFVSGALVAQAQVRVPLPGAYYFVANNTTGAFTLIFSTFNGAGQVVAVDQGSSATIFCDGTNIRLVGLPPVGSYLDICDAALPAWITACSIPPYLNCDGSTFSAVTYPYLNQKLGGNTLPDLRGTSRYALNQGTGRLTTALGGLDGNTRFSLKTTQSMTLAPTNLPPYTPVGVVGSATFTLFWRTGLGGTSAAVVDDIENSSTGGVNRTTVFTVPGGTFTGTAAPGQISTPFSSIGTGTVSGLMLIRAG